MKTKKLLLVLFLMIFALIFGACKKADMMSGEYYSRESDDGYSVPGGYSGYKGDSGTSTEAMPGEYTGFEGRDDGTTTEPANNLPRSGQLTVKAYNDNDNWDFYKSLITRGQEKDGEFFKYQEKYSLANNRIKLSFKGLSNVKVTLYV